ncbi:ribonuclease D [Gemmatimonadota bacterium]
MDYRLIEDPPSLESARPLVSSATRIALDCEAAGFHRYTDRLCLLQLSTDEGTLLLDPFEVDPEELLRAPLESRDVPVVMHGADFDIRLLQRDLGLRVRSLFDTQIAASFLGEASVGLAALLEKHVGVKLSKKHQRADWAQRPLPVELLSYAAADTRHLLKLAEGFELQLRELGRLDWAEEEFRLLEEIRWEEDATDPLMRVKGAHHLGPRAATALREALLWRDEIAREKDRAPFRVVGDATLLAAVLERPATIDELASLKGMSPRMAGAKGRELLSRLRRVDALAEDSLQPYPNSVRSGVGRPSPEEENQAERLRSLRTSRAEELGIDRGVLLSNATIGEIVRAKPRSTEELRTIDGVRVWQAELLGGDIVAILDGRKNT